MKFNKFVYNNREILFPSDAHPYIRSFWERGCFYEQDMLEYIALECQQEGVFIDVGAANGNHSLFFSLFCKATQVFSFEPNKEHHKYFLELMNANDCKNVTLSEFAVSSKKHKETVIYVLQESGQTRTGEAETTTLDEFIPSTLTISVIKIDVEGHELKVLQGAKQILAKHSPRLYIECLNSEQFNLVKNFLADYNFTATGKIFNPSPTYEFVKIL